MVNILQRHTIARYIQSLPTSHRTRVCYRRPAMSFSSTGTSQGILSKYITMMDVMFRPKELQQIAGKALGQDYCPEIANLAEGVFNKVFLLRAKNIVK
ncbi:hypothetical protein N7492_002564 [Penicillium capsulatum]|uniref:Uncharacterized protein n=1 Tax=Penicillium capsulatum TaxID=69766 RepID=A0A9W9II24_9EURO|nr:hypothetical protein N7492_002564 [Penicillium capsulatum]KAJ6122833.1 hypothetical protein N7512_005298 [Penicillium capsulatum]